MGFGSVGWYSDLVLIEIVPKIIAVMNREREYIDIWLGTHLWLCWVINDRDASIDFNLDADGFPGSV